MQTYNLNAPDNQFQAINNNCSLEISIACWAEELQVTVASRKNVPSLNGGPPGKNNNNVKVDNRTRSWIYT